MLKSLFLTLFDPVHRCCPGGFSSYILEKNPHATGTGISLETANGGHAYLLEKHHRSRHEILFCNLTYFQLGPTQINDDNLRTIPPDIQNRNYDLVLLDGHQLRGQVSAVPWDLYRLEISQVILALLAVKAGGIIIMKMFRPETLYAAKILYLLDILSRGLSTCKPRSMHANRGSFYAVAKDVGFGRASERFSEILESLKHLWVDLTYGGDEGKGRFMTETDLDFIISTHEIAEVYLDRLMELGRDIWAIQAEALASLLLKKNVVVSVR
jgi:hypothetical protein